MLKALFKRSYQLNKATNKQIISLQFSTYSILMFMKHNQSKHLLYSTFFPCCLLSKWSPWLIIIRVAYSHYLNFVLILQVRKFRFCLKSLFSTYLSQLMFVKEENDGRCQPIGFNYLDIIVSIVVPLTMAEETVI